MSLPLTVEFDGLTPLVPKRDSGSSIPATQWLAVLPDLRETFGPIGQKIPRAVAPHVACVVVPDRAVDPLGSDKRPSMIFRSRRFDDQLYRLHVFDQEKLSIDSGVPPSDRHLQVDLKEFGTEVPNPQTNEAYNLGWVAPLIKMDLQKAEVFNQQLITADDRPNPNWRNASSSPPRGLIGTVLFDHGTLTTDGVVTYENEAGEDVPGVFEFRPGSHLHRQTQADHVVLKDDIDASSLTLKFHGRQSQTRRLKLLPVADEFKIWVFNLELETILGIGESTHPDDGSDPDFAVCYALSTGWPFAGGHEPLPIPFPDWTEPGGSRKTCNPGRFEGMGDGS